MQPSPTPKSVASGNHQRSTRNTDNKHRAQQRFTALQTRRRREVSESGTGNVCMCEVAHSRERRMYTLGRVGHSLQRRCPSFSLSLSLEISGCRCSCLCPLSPLLSGPTYPRLRKGADVERMRGWQSRQHRPTCIAHEPRTATAWQWREWCRLCFQRVPVFSFHLCFLVSGVHEKTKRDEGVGAVRRVHIRAGVSACACASVRAQSLQTPQGLAAHPSVVMAHSGSGPLKHSHAQTHMQRQTDRQTHRHTDGRRGRQTRAA